MIQVYDLVFTAAPGEVSDLSVSGAEGTSAQVRLQDASAPIAPGDGCASDNAGVLCSVPFGSARIDAREYDLGDGDDKATFTASPAAVVAGAGDDTVRFDNSFGIAKLGAGDDRASAAQRSAGELLAVTVEGGPGTDTIGADPTGRVRASYADRAVGVRASLDGVADDGEPGENDVLGPGVTAIIGGSGPDRLSGGPADDALMGGAGDDVLRGLAGRDSLEGGDGGDTLDGGEGDEAFTAEAGGDIVRGGPGSDSMSYVRGQDDTRPVTVTLDDLPGDGVPGEGDDIGSDVESLEGGWGNDQLTGSQGPDRLTAVRGVDVLDGRGGPDVLTSNDATVGMLTGGSGADRFRQVGITDSVRAADGEADSIACRAHGIAAIEGDRADTGTGCLGGLDVPNRRRRVKVDSRGRLRLPVTCGDLGLVCAGTVTIRSAGRAVARGRVKVRQGTTRGRTLRLSRRARRTLRARGSLRVRVTFTTTRSLPTETRRHSEALKLVPGR